MPDGRRPCVSMRRDTDNRKEITKRDPLARRRTGRRCTGVHGQLRTELRASGRALQHDLGFAPFRQGIRLLRNARAASAAPACSCGRVGLLGAT
jgi:hypothetical protein